MMIAFLDFNIWLRDYGYIIAIVVALLIAIIVIFLLIRNKKKGKKKINEVHNEIIVSLGGIENVVDADAKMSRLNVILKDYSSIDEEKLKELGISRIIKMSNKLTLLVGEEAKTIASIIKKLKE